MLLLDVVVLALAGDAHPEGVPVEPERLAGVRDDDGGVVDAQEQRRWGAVLMPAVLSLPARERDDLEEMTVRIAEVERVDAAGVRVPIGQTLRSRRRVLDAVVSQFGVR